MLDFRTLWDNGLTFDAFMAASTKHKGLWEGLYKIARIPDWAVQSASRGPRRKLLVIAEDWCGDASSTVPVLARLAATVPGLELRIILRDQNPEVINEYLTNGSRSIPIVIALDEEFREVGHWGPRPRELQAWVMTNRDTVPKAELYPQVRHWYAKDRGETTLGEVLEAAGLERAETTEQTETAARIDKVG